MIADFRLPIADLKDKSNSSGGLLVIGNWQSEIGNDSDGRPAPAHTKLGAKWVEVRKRRVPAEGDSKMKANLKRPATTVAASLEIKWKLNAQDLTKVLLSNREQPGSVGHPTHCQLAIADCQLKARSVAGAFQSAIGN